MIACLGKLNFMVCNFSCCSHANAYTLNLFVYLLPFSFFLKVEMGGRRKRKHTSGRIYFYDSKKVGTFCEEQYSFPLTDIKSRIQTTLKQITFSIIDILNVVLILLLILFFRFVEMTITAIKKMRKYIMNIISDK